MKYMDYQFNVIFRPEPEGGFTTVVPSLPGCVSYGKSLTEAQRMIQDAIEGYIESLKKRREPIPTDSSSMMTTIQVRKSEKRRVYAAKAPA